MLNFKKMGKKKAEKDGEKKAEKGGFHSRFGCNLIFRFLGY